MNGWINKRHGDCLYRRLTVSRVGRVHDRRGGRRYEYGETHNLTLCDVSLSRHDANARVVRLTGQHFRNAMKKLWSKATVPYTIGKGLGE